MHVCYVQGRCGLNFFNSNSLANHIKRIHENPDRPFACEVCMKKFISQVGKHVTVGHSFPKPYFSHRPS